MNGLCRVEIFNPSLEDRREELAILTGRGVDIEYGRTGIIQNDFFQSRAHHNFNAFYEALVMSPSRFKIQDSRFKIAFYEALRWRGRRVRTPGRRLESTVEI